MESGQYKPFLYKYLNAILLCARVTFLYTPGIFEHRVQLRLEPRRGIGTKGAKHTSGRWNPSRAAMFARQEEADNTGVKVAQMGAPAPAVEPCSGSLASDCASENSLSQLLTLAPRCSRPAAVGRKG